MTVIECFEREPIDNLATCLSLRPTTLVLIGEGEALAENAQRHRDFLSRRRLPTVVDDQNVEGKNIHEVIALIDGIVTKGDECIIDLAGGEPMVLAAAGAVYERRRHDYPVTLQRIDTLTGDVEDCDGDGVTEQLSSPRITVKELIALYGGGVTSSATIPPHITRGDIAPLWNALVRNTDVWNKQVSYLNEFEKHADKATEERCVNLHFGEVRTAVANYPEKRQLFDRFITDLQECGVIAVRSRAEGDFGYRYRSDFLRQCLQKEGNALECKTLLEARAAQLDGKSLFSDCLMGVNIDWDGVVHPIVRGGTKDTKNEIDVVLMRGLTPVFISCKNGGIGEDELYKLNTVAQRFGGERVKKALIATNYCPPSEDTRLATLQRAQDMGIYFEPDAASLTDAGWLDFFLNVLKDE